MSGLTSWMSRTFFYLDEQQEIEQYSQGYQKQPQTDEEFGWSDRAR